MSALAQILGRLVGEPPTFPTKTGGRLTSFKMKVANGHSLEFWEVLVFSDTVREELEGLAQGASLSAVGTLQVDSYEWNGAPRIKLKLIADQLLALKLKAREPKAKTGKVERSPASRPKPASAPPRSAWEDRSYAGGGLGDDIEF